MKNLLTVLSLVMVASPAFASRARLEALGEGKNGSYYINDGRNIFLNPASINNFKKNMWLELGTAGNTVDSITGQSTTTTAGVTAPTTEGSKVQGGFTNTFGDFTYGVYVGRESDRLNNTITLLNVFGAALTTPDHAFEFFLGGEQGVKWGASVYYAGALDQSTTTKTASVLGAKAGIETSGLNVFTTVGLSSSSKNAGATAATTDELKGNLSLDVGATYAMDNMTYLAKFTSTSSDFTDGSAALTTNFKTTAIGVGAGWKKEATKSVNMFSRLQFDYQKNAFDTNNAALNTIANGANVGNETWYNLPLVLAAEAQATSWLTVRGSVSHSLVGQYQRIETDGATTKDSMNNMTTVAAGLGFNFGDLTIDALFGQSAAVAGAASESSMASAQTGSRFGFGDNMVSRLSLNYNF